MRFASHRYAAAGGINVDKLNQTRKVVKIVPHPESDGDVKNDICLVKVKMKICQLF